MKSRSIWETRILVDCQVTKEDRVGLGNKVQMDLRDPHLDKVSPGDTRQGKLRRKMFCFRR